MSFLKMTDPKRRYFIVNEFLKTRQNIQQNYLSERVGDLSTQHELSKLFKPVTDIQKDLKEGLVSELKPIREGMKNLPKAITFQQFPEVKIKENNIIVGIKEYTGTPGLWELIVARSSDDKIFTNGDYDNYAEIMHSTNALRRNNDESETKPKASESWKWKHILKPIWDEKDLYTGNGLTPSVSFIFASLFPM